jgi:hypothetical protein
LPSGAIETSWIAGARVRSLAEGGVGDAASAMGAKCMAVASATTDRLMARKARSH